MAKSMKKGCVHWTAVIVTTIFMLFLCMPIYVQAAEKNTETALSVEVLNQNSQYEDNGFLDLISIPTSSFTYENNGGAVRGLDRAFDRNWDTDWISAVDNNYKDPFYNTVTVHFKETVTIDSILYACSGNKTGYGFPTQFKIYSSLGNGTMELVGYGAQAATASKIRIVFPKAVTCDHLTFEFYRVNTAHKYVASAKEFIFLQPMKEIGQIQDLFTDYAKYQIDSKYASAEKIQELRKTFESYINYEENIEPLLDRAESILNGELTFDARREFSTSPDAKNVIERHGNIAGYAKNTLKFNSFGTNRQVTGIAVRAGEQVKIYAEGSDNDPLPKIRFSQACGYWSSWLGPEIQLSPGLNVLTVPDFKTNNYSTEVVSGGSVYIVNPYTEEQQYSSVKVYIESGDLFPVFRKGDDEESYKKQLSEYVEKINANSDTVVNVTELVSNHTIMTVQATRADQIYQTASPQANMENWDETIRDMLAFSGVSFNKEDTYYDEKNNYLNVNYRTSQNWPGSGMYAHTEHIGIYVGGSEDTLINSLNDSGNSRIGWGHCHEAGHMLDIPERTKGETSNNMVANYNNTYKLKIIRNENYFNSALTKLSSDRTLEKNLWDADQYNYMVYWLIQSLYTDYWGDQDNLYRYMTGITGLSRTEKQVYLSSLATGIDLSYYFERWGYHMTASEAPFTYEASSDAFKHYITQAKTENKIRNEVKKFWYFDSAQFNYMMDYADLENGIGGMYNDSSETEIINVQKGSDGYYLIMPEVTDQEHLGYEILEGNEQDGYTVIGFTHTNSFTDTSIYDEEYQPSYKVVAYDRLLNHSKESEAASPKQQKNVCELNGVIYDSVSGAVKAAAAGDTIYILKDFTDTGIVIDKNLTITMKDDAGQDITIFKSGANAVFQVNANVTFTLNGTDSKHMILDGNHLKQAFALIQINGNGKLNINRNVILQNNINTGNGGAISVTSSGARIALTDVICRDNQANSGGAIYNVGTITVTNGSFTANTATDGGAVSNVKGGVITITNTAFTENAGQYGGALCIDGNTKLRNTVINKNKAVSGGAVYIAPTQNAASRSLTIENGTQIYDNSADYGSAVYMDRSAQIIVNSAAVYGNESIYKKSGSILVKGRMIDPKQDKITFICADYDAQEPIFTTDFDLTEEDLSGIRIPDEVCYRFIIGENKRSVYLEKYTPVYSVTLETNGGVIGEGDVQSYVSGTAVALPTDVRKDGYEFYGWYEDAVFSGEKVAEIPANAVGDKIYYAKWVKKTETPNVPDQPDKPDDTEKPDKPDSMEKPDIPEGTEKPDKPDSTEKPDTSGGTENMENTGRPGNTENSGNVEKQDPIVSEQTAVSKITLSGISGKIAAGKKIRLSAAVFPSNASNQRIIWKSSNTKVAVVDSNGTVRMKKGSGGKTVVITATAADESGVKASFKIKSMKGIVKKVTVSGSKSVKAGKSLKLRSQVRATKKANTKLKWFSSNTKYANVSSSGKVKTYRAGKGKKVKITAMATDGSGKKQTITIKIK